MTEANSLKTYPEWVAGLRKNIDGDAALEAAVGGDFLTVGRLEFALLRELGLHDSHSVVDIGCGSGRLAVQLSALPGLCYVGVDVVPDLLAHAQKLCRRPDWRFVQTAGTRIPCEDHTADFVCFFSVFTHLLHEDSFRYLREATRVLRPGGRIVFSFLEFHIFSHWSAFELSVDHEAEQQPLSQFIGRDAIEAWAHHLGLVVEHVFDGDKPHIEIDEPVVWQDGRVMRDRGALGQSVAVLRKKDPKPLPSTSEHRGSLADQVEAPSQPPASAGPTVQADPVAPAPPSSYGWAECFSLLKQHRFAPRRILDVGANRGSWTRAAVKFFPAASYILVEPQAHLRAQVDDLKNSGHAIQWISAGVGDKPGQLLLSVTSDEVSSSFLPSETEAARHGFKQVPVTIRTVNEIVAREWGEVPEMVKIDAEGYDLKALAGSSNLFGKTDIFFVEAAVCATGLENTMAAVVSTMSAAGYKLIDMMDLNRSPKYGVLWLCELVFMRESCPLLERVSSYR